MPLTPFFRSPFTDLTGCLINHQTYDKCGVMEMDMMECMEAYGSDRGKIMCKDLIEDFNECYTMKKQYSRYMAMISERNRQHRAGELKDKDHHAPAPRVDAY